MAFSEPRTCTSADRKSPRSKALRLDSLGDNPLVMPPPDRAFPENSLIHRIMGMRLWCVFAPVEKVLSDTAHLTKENPRLPFFNE